MANSFFNIIYNTVLNHPDILDDSTRLNYKHPDLFNTFTQIEELKDAVQEHICLPNLKEMVTFEIKHDFIAYRKYGTLTNKQWGMFWRIIDIIGSELD